MTLQQASARPRVQAAPSARITEIDGLRGISLLLVVLFHLFGQGRVSGGVDVFLMISGFLLTLSLARSLGSGRPLGIVARWARTFIRLTPPAAIVLIAVTIASFVILDPREQLATLREVVAAVLYRENWQLISANLEYGAAGASTSPLQHFWSLAVQAQFFLIFPLIALVISWIVRTPEARVRALWVVVGAATIASFAFAWKFNATDPSAAYFHTFARAWELGVGGIVAGLWMRGIVIPERLRPATGWIGLAMIVACGFLIDGGSAYPGPLALMPIGGAAIVLLSSGGSNRFAASRFLSSRILVRFDAISYGMYLWHWPILICYHAYRGHEAGRVDFAGAVGVLILAYVLTLLTTSTLRVPLRAAASRGTATQVVAILVAIIIGGGPAAAGASLITLSSHVALTACSGAAALDPEKPECADFHRHDSWMPPAGIIPLEATRATDEATRSGCWSANAADEFNICSIGDPAGEMRFLALGDSHMAMYTDALDAIGRERGWNIQLASRGHCRWIDDSAKDVDMTAILHTRCTNWRESAEAVVARGEYDAILTTNASFTSLVTPEGVDPLEFETDNILKAWGVRPDPQNTPIVVIRDNPRVLSSVQKPCLGNTEALVAGFCSTPREDAIADTGYEAAVERDPNARMIDLNDYICGPEACNPVVGGVYVYRDNAHMTRTFVETLTPYLERELVAALR